MLGGVPRDDQQAVTRRTLSDHRALLQRLQALAGKLDAACAAGAALQYADGHAVLRLQQLGIPLAKVDGQLGRQGVALLLEPLDLPEQLRALALELSLIHISEPTRLGMISYAVFC